MKREVAEVGKLIDLIEAVKVPGMGLSVGSTFLHFLYPSTVPIYDKFVLEALSITDKKPRDCFRKYLTSAWPLAYPYADRVPKGGVETPLRAVEMALWLTRARKNSG